jgi:hypothetical protein
LTFGLGKATRIDRVIVQWPGKNGGREDLSNLALNKVHVIKQNGKKLPLS